MSARLKLVFAFTIASSAMLFTLASFNAGNVIASAQKNSPVGYGQIDRQRLLAANQHPENWLTEGRDFGRSHFSPLTQINKQTVGRLGFAWDYATHTTRGLEATPIVVDGVMYTSGVAGRAYALDAKTGKELWSFDPKSDMQINRRACCDQVNRGVAVWKGKVYVFSFDGRLFALNAATGAVEWQVDTIIDKTKGYAGTGAPEIAGHVVVIGNAGSDADARGYVTGYDLDTGKQMWRFFTVPGDPSKPYENPELEMAAKTWDPKSRWDMGGGTVWDAITYDPELNLVYIGTGNGPYSDQSRRSPSGGDNLFIDSILAINPDNGRLVWHYQETPGDQWDYDAMSMLMLSDLKIDGKVRKVIMQASKNGFYYVLDRKTGKLLRADKLVPVTWADHVDLKTGRPVETADARKYKHYRYNSRFISPGPAGAHNWNPFSYDARKGIAYVAVYENDPMHPFPAGKAFLRAWDVARGKVIWEVPMVAGWDRAGVLATAGGLVFQGNGPGHFRVYDSETGKLLKDIDVGTTIIAAPMTYSVDGEQYVAVMAAWGGGGWANVYPELAAYTRGNQGRIVAFRLDGGPTPKPALLPPLQPMPQPPALTASAEKIQHGAKLFQQFDCGHCHKNEPRAIDLRRRVPNLTREQVHQIVLGGMFLPLGMPSFAKPARSAGWEGDGVLSPADVDDIYDYIISMSWDAYKKQQGISSESSKPVPAKVQENY